MLLKKISDNLEFKDILACSKSDIQAVLEIRNEDEIRLNMFNSKIISIEEHLLWAKNFLKTVVNRFYCLKYKNVVIGGLSLKNYDILNLTADWGFYISAKKNFMGLGFVVEYKALNYFFSKYKINDIFCYVLNSNKIVINLHKKFGFKKTYIDRNFEDLYLNVNRKNVFRMKLNKTQWNVKSNYFQNKFFKYGN
jgi:UDP-4-amino-4,6-dideoxy-N-acetyl-beta-L-altrosamine N-acetyltransferase